MKLLVSAASAADAAAALDGGASFIDAKNPEAGPLGPVPLDVFHAIVAAVAGRQPVTAALGDGQLEAAVEADARAFAAAGATLVKMGFAGVRNLTRARALADAAVRGARQGHAAAGVVLVAYADAPGDAVSPAALLEVASSAGAAGVLLDTADKGGPGLTALVSLAWLTEWVSRAHARSLTAALAGRVCADDLTIVRRSGADVVGVRGAACDGGRSGRISAAKVRAMGLACRDVGETVASW
jgi:uncharacterized protein (UPF0264 family)